MIVAPSGCVAPHGNYPVTLHPVPGEAPSSGEQREAAPMPCGVPESQSPRV